MYTMHEEIPTMCYTATIDLISTQNKSLYHGRGINVLIGLAGSVVRLCGRSVIFQNVIYCQVNLEQDSLFGYSLSSAYFPSYHHKMYPEQDLHPVAYPILFLRES